MRSIIIAVLLGGCTIDGGPGSLGAVESPFANDRPEENHNPVGRVWSADELTELYADDELDKRNIAVVSAGRGAQHTRMGVLNFSFYDWRRKVARLKYTIANMGLPAFKTKVGEYYGSGLPEPRPTDVHEFADHIGWDAQGDGRWFYGLNVENGRIKDENSFRILKKDIASERQRTDKKQLAMLKSMALPLLEKQLEWYKSIACEITSHEY